jgi:hypothetical protein
MSVNSCDKVKVSQVRKIGPTRRSVSGMYSFKGLTTVAFESTLERDLLIREEFFTNVLDIVAQPVTIPFIGANGNEYTYTPDFLIYRRLEGQSYHDYPKPLLVEVKPKQQWQENWRLWSYKWKAARRYAKSQGWLFRIYDEERIRDQTFHNIRFLERYKRMSFAEEESQWVIDSVKLMGCAPLHYLLSRHFMGMYKSLGVAHIWHLVAMRRLDCDISEPLNDMTELWVASNAF